MTLNRATEPPDGGYGWVVLACCAICMSTVIGLGRTNGMIFVEIIELYDINRTQAFLVIVTIRLFAFAFAPFIGKLLTKYDYSVVLCAGSLLLSLSLILTACTTEYWQVLITYGCLHGLGSNCVMAASVVTVGLYFNKRRSLAMGIMYAIGGVNGFISPLLFHWLLETYYLHGALLIMGGLALHTCAFAMLVRQPTWIPREKGEPKEEELVELTVKNPLPPLAPHSNGVGNGVPKYKSEVIKPEEKCLKEPFVAFVYEEQHPKKESPIIGMLKEMRQDLKLFKDGLFLLQLFNRSFTLLTVTYFLSLLPDFAEVELEPHVTKKEVAFVLSMASIGDIIVRLIIGWVLDRLPWRKQRSLGGVSFLMGLTVVFFQFAQIYTHLVIGSVCFGICIGMYIVMQNVVERELAGPTRVHMANGFTRFVVGGVNVTGGVLIGYLRDRLGSYKVCLSLLGGAGIVGGLVWVFEPLVLKCFPPLLQEVETNDTKNKKVDQS